MEGWRMSAQGFLHLLLLLSLGYLHLLALRPSTFAFPLPLPPLLARPETSLVPLSPSAFSAAASMCTVERFPLPVPLAWSDQDDKRRSCGEGV